MATTIYSHVYRNWGSKPKSKEVKFKPITSAHLPKVTSVRSGAMDYKLHQSADEQAGVVTVPVERPQYEGEMLERELAARKEIEYKKTCVAIPYNKGAYQYVTEGMDPKNFGRK